jgi:hypothetical protein
MSYQTSAAVPDRLAAFAAAHPAIDEPLACATLRAVAGLAEVAAAAGGVGSLGEDLLVPLLDLRAEAAYQATWVGAVGAAFRAAGADIDGDGVVTARDDDLPPVGSASRADRLAEVAALLASLRERAAAGGPTITAGELATVLATARDLVATAPDPGAEAARILATVGAGDVAVAVDLLGEATSDATDPAHVAVAALFDLGALVSLGLEGQPERAERWAHQLTGTLAAHDLVGDGRVDGVALLGGGNAPGAATFGVALAAGLQAGGVETRRWGPVHRLYGTTHPLAPTVAAAGARGVDGRFAQVPLAHGLVADLARAEADRGQALAGVFGGARQPGMTWPGPTPCGPRSIPPSRLPTACASPSIWRRSSASATASSPRSPSSSSTRPPSPRRSVPRRNPCSSTGPGMATTARSASRARPGPAPSPTTRCGRRWAISPSSPAGTRGWAPP